MNKKITQIKTIVKKESIRKCKYCKKEILFPLSGLRDFCSEECKKAYRNKYQAILMKKKRSVSKKVNNDKPLTNQGVTNNVKNSGYIDINSSDVSKSEPYTEPIYEGEKSSLGLSEDNFESYGGRDWFNMAKKYCCNFDRRQKEGYCITLAEPYMSFKMKCSECSFGKYYKESKKKNA